MSATYQPNTWRRRNELPRFVGFVCHFIHLKSYSDVHGFNGIATTEHKHLHMLPFTQNVHKFFGRVGKTKTDEKKMCKEQKANNARFADAANAQASRGKKIVSHTRARAPCSCSYAKKLITSKLNMHATNPGAGAIPCAYINVNQAKLFKRRYRTRQKI